MQYIPNLEFHGSSPFYIGVATVPFLIQAKSEEIPDIDTPILDTWILSHHMLAGCLVH
jgi:citrate lyase synthetase